MSKIMHLVYDDYNGNLYGYIDYRGCACAEARRQGDLLWTKQHGAWNQSRI